MDAKEIAEILTAREKTVSVAEADTAGLIGYMLGAIPGSSKYFPGGVIAYTGGLKAVSYTHLTLPTTPYV